MDIFRSSPRDYGYLERYIIISHGECGMKFGKLKGLPHETKVGERRYTGIINFLFYYMLPELKLFFETSSMVFHKDCLFVCKWGALLLIFQITILYPVATEYPTPLASASHGF